MSTPLPARTTANDRLISSTPYAQLTDRQKQYAAKYGVRLQPAPAAGPGRSHPFSSNDGAAGTPAVPTGAVSTGAVVSSPTGTISAPVASTTAPTVDGTDAARRDALALLQQVFAGYGLPADVGRWAWSELQAGKGNDEILLDLEDPTESNDGAKAFYARFPAIKLRREAGLPALSPSYYVSYENSAQQMYRAAGFPAGFYDSPEDYTNLLAKNVSLSELSQRITDAQQAAFNTPEQDRAEFYRLGFGHGDLTAMFLNPDLAEPLLHKQLAAAGIAGASQRTGYGALNADQALGLTDLGVTSQQAQDGFASLAHQHELFGALNAGEDQISQSEQLGAQFGGNADAQRRINDRARSRVAAFSGGGGYGGSQTGLSGLGNSGR